MKKYLLPIFLTITTLFFTSCSDDTSYTLDNPTEDAITVQIDDKKYELDEYSRVTIKLAPGAHQLISKSAGTVNFTVYPDRNGGIINPTLTTYILLNEVYTVDTASRESYRPSSDTIIVNGKSYTANFKRLDGLFIPEQWSYDLDEELPDEVTVYNNKSGTIKSKIFSLEDFVLYYLNYYGKPDNARGQKAVVMTRAQILAFNQPTTLPDFLSAEFQEATLPLRALYTEYMQTIDPEQQKALQEQYHKMMSQYVTDTMYLHAKQSTEENNKANDFTTQVSNLFGTSFLITSYK